MKPCLVYYIALWLLLPSTISFAQESDCSQLDDQTVKAIFGWPIYLSCDELIEYDNLYELSTTAYCIMMDVETNETLFNVSFITEDYDFADLTYTISEVTTETPTTILLTVSVFEGGCYSQRVTLETVELANDTCEVFSNKTEDFVMRNLLQGVSGRSLVCEPRDTTQTFDFSDFNVTWYYNCKTELPNDVERVGDNLIIRTADYHYHPGVYSCSLHRDGQEKFIVSHLVCVKPTAWSDLVTIRCPEVLSYDVGDTVNIDCNVDIGDGDLNSETYSMRFYPLLSNGIIDVSKDDISCTSFLGQNRTTRKEDSRVSCIFSYVTSESEPKCFTYIPMELEWETERNKTISTLSMSYRMKSVRREDFGEYLSEIKNIRSEDIGSDKTIIQEAEYPENRALIIGCAVGAIVLFIIIVAVLYFGFRVEIQCWWRHTPFSKLEKNPREYGAYLAYHWNGEENGSDQLRAMIPGMKEFLKKINCPVYDSALEFPDSGKWDAMKEAQQSSDRVIVVLTPQYIRLEENNFELYASFHDTPFIFIKTPGTDESIKMIGNDKNRNALRIHLKRSKVINWRPNNATKNGRQRGEVPCEEIFSKKFRMELELAMPKRELTVVYHNDDVQINGRHGDARV